VKGEGEENCLSNSLFVYVTFKMQPAPRRLPCTYSPRAGSPQLVLLGLPLPHPEQAGARGGRNRAGDTRGALFEALTGSRPGVA
jgi:hypothetical protein